MFTDPRPGLLRAVCERPDDDLPRRLFADACDEAGDPVRAEFVRIQLELAQSPLAEIAEADRHHHAIESKVVDNQRYGTLRRRGQELLRRHWDEWTADLPGPKDSTVGFHFARGFPEQITCTWPDFARHADALRAATPLREVVLTTYPYQQAQVVPGRTRDELELEILARQYPGITFTLPEPDRLLDPDAIPWPQEETAVALTPDDAVVYGPGQEPRSVPPYQ